MIQVFVMGSGHTHRNPTYVMVSPTTRHLRSTALYLSLLSLFPLYLYVLCPLTSITFYSRRLHSRIVFLALPARVQGDVCVSHLYALAMLVLNIYS